jgi:hypothetical protein
LRLDFISNNIQLLVVFPNEFTYLYHIWYYLILLDFPNDLM